MRKTTPRQIISILGLGTAISLLGEATLYTVLPIPEYAAQMGVTITMVGIILGANRMVRLVTNGPVGLLYEKKAKRPLLTLSLVLAALASCIYSLGYGFWPLFIGRLVWGLGWSFQWIGCRTMILEVSNDENRARMNGLYQMFFLGGVGFASLAGSFLAEKLGFRLGQQISAGVILAAAIGWHLLLPREDSGERCKQKAREKGEKKPLLWPIIIPTIIIMFITRFIERGVLAATTSLWIHGLFDGEALLFGVLLTATTISGIYNAVKFMPSMASAPLIGFISDKLKKRWIVIAVMMALISAGLWLMSSEILYAALFGGLFLAFFNGSTETLVPAIVGDEIRVDMIPRTLGVIYIGADLGAMLGPIVSLAVIDAGLLSVSQLYLSCIGLLAISTLVSLITSAREKIRV